MPIGLEIDSAIGLFHAHCHKKQCLFRYAPSFIPHTGVISGETAEILWSTMNTITPAARTATLAHRAELIDDHAADLNHKKRLGIGKSCHCVQLQLALTESAVLLEPKYEGRNREILQ